jgi:predicted GNAT family acetyltransferase
MMTSQIDVDNLEVRNNPTEGRFEVQLGDKIGQIVYYLEGQSIVFVHTEVPREYGGQGIADKMATTALEYARSEHLKVVPLCPFMSSYIRRHPEYRSLVTGG